MAELADALDLGSSGVTPVGVQIPSLAPIWRKINEEDYKKRGYTLSYKLKSLKKVENNKVKLDIEIANSHLKKSINRAYREISRKAKIPGFRKGKVPFNIIDINFGKEYVLNEAASISISEVYPQIIEESDLKPIDYPKVKIIKVEENLPLNFEVILEVEPEIVLPKYKGINVVGISEEATDNEIDKQIDNIRNNYATLEPVEADKQLVQGDFATIDFEGKIGGKDFEGNSAKDYTLEIGSKTLFEEFENSLIGMKKGDKKSEKLTLPDDIANKELVGKQADFNIYVKDIKSKSLPEIDGEFLKNMGDYKDVDEFRKYIKDKMLEQKKKIRRGKIVEDILNYLLDNTKVDLPEVMINNRIKQIGDDFDSKLKEQKVKKGDYLKAINITEDKFGEEIRKRAIREIKEYLIFNALEKAEKGNIEPSDEDIDKEAEEIVGKIKKEDERNKIGEFFKNPEGRSNLASTIRRRNIIDILISSAKINEEKKDLTQKVDKRIWTPKENVSEKEDKNKKLWTPKTKDKEE